MMNVMQTDVAGEPLKYFWQLEIRTSIKSDFQRVPGLMANPIGIFELVLDVEQPHTEPAANDNDW